MSSYADSLSMRSHKTGVFVSRAGSAPSESGRTETTSREGTTAGESAQMSLDGTPAPSNYSFSSSRDGRSLLRELEGRVLNSTNDLYMLPAGEFHLCLRFPPFLLSTGKGGLLGSYICAYVPLAVIVD